MRFSFRKRSRLRTVGAVAAVGALTVGGLILPSATRAASASPTIPTSVQLTPEGLPQGAIKHVWLIILENKSYDGTFTGLNNNSYLWKTLPSQGVLLKNYYGTGHSSQDNYLSMVSGQAPEEDVQSDCSVQDYNFGSNASTDATTTDVNFGQTASAAGANAANGLNGCTFPTAAPTLFNQLDAAGETWKGYAQDLGGASANSPTAAPSGSGTIDLRPGSDVTNREASACGGPGSSTNFPGAYQSTASLTGSTSTNSPSTYGVSSFTGAQADDQYVAKHFPFPWFHSLIGSGNGSSGITTPTENGQVTGYDCDSAHIANLDSPTNGLEHDLQSESTTPAFSWITPDNCSDAHDATCVGNNLSGAFDSQGNPMYTTTPQAYDPESTTPTNFTGGLYASDLFLRYYIPLIERSAAFADGGLIDVTFDEANPPFTYSGNSFNNQPTSTAAAGGQQGDTTQPANCSTTAPVTEPCTPTYGSAGTTAPGASSVYGAYGILADAAGENINGTNVSTEPTGPNSTLATNPAGDQLYPGPGNNSFIDRPPVCTSGSTTSPAGCVAGEVRGGSGTSPGVRNDTVSGTAGSTMISDPSIQADDTGRQVTDTTDAGFPANSGGVFVGEVTDSGPTLVNQSGTGKPYTGQFQLVDSSGNPVTLTSPVTKVTLSAEGAPGSLSAGQTPDPLFDAADPTPGGGDTGSILISPYITPGTSTTTYYNHYSWLRTMEDLFNVSSGAASTSNNPVFLTDSNGTSYTVAGGLDNLGHLGFASQKGLTPFGADVFNNPAGNTPNPLGPGAQAPESPLTVGLPLLAVLVGGTFLVLRRRQRRQAPKVV